MRDARKALMSAVAGLMNEVFSVERFGAKISIDRIKSQAIEVGVRLRELNETEPLARPACREDVGSTCNIDRRKFWERCASRPPIGDPNPRGVIEMWWESAQDVAGWADDMLAEWDRRWVTAGRWRCGGCDEDDVEPAVGEGGVCGHRVPNPGGPPLLCGPLVWEAGPKETSS